MQDAAAHYRAALRVGGADAAYIQRSWGKAWEEAGRIEKAAAHYREALRLNPDYAQGHNSLD